jgi:hypothetical protein
MQNKHRRTEIRIETHEVKVVRLRTEALDICEVCGKVVSGLAVEQAGQVLGMTQDQMLRLLEDKRLHLVNSQRGAPICGDSFGTESEFVTRKALSTSL